MLEGLGDRRRQREGDSSEYNFGSKSSWLSKIDGSALRLSGMKLPMLLTPLVLLNPLGLPLLNLTKQVPGEEVIKPVFKSGLAQQRLCNQV